MDPKIKKTIDDWRWLLKRQELASVTEWWSKSLPVNENFFKKHSLLAIGNKRLSEKIKKFLIQARIPQHFFDGLNQIKVEPLLYSSQGKKLRGCYRPVSRRIILSYDLRDDDVQLQKTLYHELGHHCSDQLNLEIPGAAKMFEKLKAYFPVAFRSQAEFFAQLFSMAFAQGEEKDALEFLFDVKITPNIFKVKKKV